MCNSSSACSEFHDFCKPTIRIQTFVYTFYRHVLTNYEKIAAHQQFFLRS